MSPPSLFRRLASAARTAAVARKTKETDISCEINIDGTGKNDVDTGIGFLDHMFCAMSKVRRCERRACRPW